MLVHVQKSEAVGHRESLLRGQGQCVTRALPRHTLTLQQVTPLWHCCAGGKLLVSLPMRCDLSAYSCSPVGNILQAPQTLFSLVSFSIYGTNFTAAPYLYSWKSRWIAQTETKKSMNI